MNDIKITQLMTHKILNEMIQVSSELNYLAVEIADTISKEILYKLHDTSEHLEEIINKFQDNSC